MVGEIFNLYVHRARTANGEDYTYELRLKVSGTKPSAGDPIIARIWATHEPIETVTKKLLMLASVNA